MKKAKSELIGKELLIVGEEVSEDQTQAISTIAHEIGVNGILEVLEALLTTKAGSLQPSDEQVAMENVALQVSATREEIRLIVSGTLSYGYSVKGWREDDTIPGSPPEPTPSQDYIDVWTD